MKVGDYVRTKHYGISKITDIYNEDKIELDKENAFGIKGACYMTENIVKSSPNIIDLIEVGDIIKGKDEHLFEVYAVGSDCVYINNLKEFILADEIKSIVTHEQIESMEYKI